jgi:integrase/recombinase XerD
VNVAVWEPRFLEHLRACGRTERTIGGYIAELRLFLAFLADRGVSEPHQLTRQDVEAYQVSLLHRRKPNGDPLSLKTRHTKMSAALVFLRFLHQSQALLVNPGRGIKQPTLPRKLLPKLPSVDEVVKLLEAPDAGTPLGLRDRAIMELLYSSALRNSELRGLKLEDLDLERLELRVANGKGRKPRVVPIGEPAAAWVEEYLRNGRACFLREREHGLVFSTVRGDGLRVASLIKLVVKHGAAAGLPMKVTPHVLRHCCATHMLARQAGLRHLQEMLGHASPEATQVYTQVDLSELREVHQRCHPRESR